MIISANYYTIVCEVPAFDAPAAVAYVGSRGLRRFFWNNTEDEFEDLDGIVEPTTIENWLETDGPIDLGYYYYDVAEEEFTSITFPYKDIWRGLFKAPSTGDYTFFLSGDKSCSIALDTITPFSSDMITYSPTVIAEITGKSAYKNWYWHDG